MTLNMLIINDLQQITSQPAWIGKFLQQHMKKYTTYQFSGINVKKTIADRFRRFAKQISSTNSEALEAMLNFFEWNEISPNDNLDTRNTELKKRINAMIAILKDIEKTQTKPTTAMLQALFQEVETPKKNLVLEKKYFNNDGTAHLNKK